MEVSVVSQDVLRIKGKQSQIFVNGSGSEGSAVLLLGNLPLEKVKLSADDLVIEGAGDYEVGGIKIAGVSAQGRVVYTMTVDGVDVMIGTIKALESLQKILQETHILVVLADENMDASFVTSFSPVVALFAGEHADEVGKTIAKEGGIQKTAKYQVTRDKLPQEMESYVMANSK